MSGAGRSDDAHDVNRVWNRLRTRPRSLRRYLPAARRARAAVLVEACAVVSGRAADLYASAGEPVPCWTWLNALAHGSPARIRAWAVEHPESVWAAASVEVAAELERLEPARAAAIQAGVFVPAELAALSAGENTANAMVRAIRTRVTDAFRHPSGQDT